jgi:hypothetical protein
MNLTKPQEIIKSYIKNRNKTIKILLKKYNEMNIPIEEVVLLMKEREIAQIQHIKELNETHMFHIDKNIGMLLEQTNNTIYKRNIPFNNMFFQYNFKLLDRDIECFHILKDEYGIIIRIFYHKDSIDVAECIGFFDEYNIKNENSEYLKERNKLAKNIIDINNLNEKEKKQIRIFFCNFIDLINNKEVELVTIERTQEQNEKRIKKGKLPIPKISYIKLNGKLKIYINKLISEGHFKYSHKFWVRGHFRTLRDENRYGSNVGKIIWIVPFIKGKGELIKKEYEVKNG